MDDHSNDPLYKKTLKDILVFLVQEYGWEKLGEEIKIKCFTSDPSVQSSLVFLRRTPWARAKMEELYIHTMKSLERRKV